MKSALSLLGLSLALALSTGCSKNERPASTAATKTDDTTAKPVASAPRAAVDKAVEQNQGGGLNISPEIRKLCPGIPEPHFGYDSAELRGEWTTALEKLSECMKTGGLAGKKVLFTGHTDPRGDDDYNMSLGGRRAESVKAVVTAFGVTGDRVEVTSRGETDAKGTDEQTWASDRRVDIDLWKGGGSAQGVSSN
ncbi:MAG: OmpA family protein [Myxococcales bacterium]|nr:MAG: OmpA family protein [Myxococcales bacterium]